MIEDMLMVWKVQGLVFLEIEMPDDLQREEEIFLKALKEYKEKKSQEPTDKTTNTLPAVIAAVL